MHPLELLDKFAEENKMSRDELASLIGVSPRTLRRYYLADAPKPSARTRFKIEKKTGGAVPMTAWL